jgi:hypothetical protein
LISEEDIGRLRLSDARSGIAVGERQIRGRPPSRADPARQPEAHNTLPASRIDPDSMEPDFNAVTIRSV